MRGPAGCTTAGDTAKLGSPNTKLAGVRETAENNPVAAIPAPATPMVGSPILFIERGDTGQRAMHGTHSHPEPMLLWAATATLTVAAGARDWLVPPGYGLWVPGGVEHAAAALRAGEATVILFAADRCPTPWTEPTGFSVGPLLRELVVHLHRSGPDYPTRQHAEALLFGLLTPLPAHAVKVSMPTDQRVRSIAEQLIANPADPRELAAWADQVHAGVRTLSRLFRAETGLSFAQWRTQVRMRSAIQLLGSGASVAATARAVGYRKPSAFVDAFRRATGQAPGTYRD